MRAVSIDWTAVERWLELSLPDDYKSLLDEFGPHLVGGVLTVQAPCVRPGFDYPDWLRSCAEAAAMIMREAPLTVPTPPFHPGRDGLLPWATTIDGHLLCLDTAAWTCVALESGAPRDLDPVATWDFSVTELLELIVGDGVTLPSGALLGPLDPVVTRLPFEHWVVPEVQLVPPERRRALTEGAGLAALTALVTPPAEPEPAEVGTRLPAEYVALMRIYGAGTWLDWLHFPPRVEMEGGLLVFARSADADRLAWVVDGEPDEWPIVFVSRAFGPREPVTCGLATILLEWARGKPRLELAWNDEDDPLEVSTFSATR